MKTFEIEKEFAEKWIKALRGGEYQQVMSALYKGSDGTGYCCLGVACSIVDISNDDMLFIETPFDLIELIPEIETNRLPDILLEHASGTTFVDIVMSLNDGITQKDYNKFIEKYPNIVFDEKATRYEEFTFVDIANFIETNCKFI